MNEPGILGIFGRASGDFMREFTTAWRQGVPVPPPGQPAVEPPAARHPFGQPAPTVSAPQSAPPDLAAVTSRIAALEANVQELERTRLEAVIHTNAVHALLKVLLEDHLSIRTPSFKDTIQTAVFAVSQVQNKLADDGLDPFQCDPEQLITSDTYKGILCAKLRHAIALADPQQPDSKPTDD